MSLPLIRSHTRIDFKRCPKKAYWYWMLGLVPRAKSFGALDLGSWMHEAFNAWYRAGLKRNGNLADHIASFADIAIYNAQGEGAPDYEIEKAVQLADLGQAMMIAYKRFYGKDPNIEVITKEIPLEFVITQDGKPIAKHLLKPDLVFRHAKTREVWLMEHKSAASIRTEHLVIDDQARPYTAMAERALKSAGAIDNTDRVAGILYNFVRKAFPDERDMRKVDGNWRHLNKDGTVSKRQPPPYFVRHALPVSDKAKAMTLRRLQTEAIMFTTFRQSIIDGKIDPKWILKTPHMSCPKFCNYFAMCRLEEEGADITEMRRNLYVKRNPYDYTLESTDEPASFEFS